MIASACSDATEGTSATPISVDADFVVQTSLSQESVKAGTAVQAVCVVKNRDGMPVTMETFIRTVPEGEAQIVDHTITPTKAGVIQVQCGISGSAIIDDTPATLVVFEGPAIRTVAEVSPASIQSGQTSTVTCRVEDEYGNDIPNLPTTVELTNTSVALVTGMTLKGQQVGSTQVICAQAQVAADARVPATLTVSVGSASKLTMQVTPELDWYAPGDVVNITAYVTDDWGNPVGSGVASVNGPNTGVTKNSASSWTLNTEGAHVFTASDSSGLQGAETLMVDGTAPELVLVLPERGSIVTNGDVVEVDGIAQDAMSGLDEVTVNGYTVNVNASGNFNVGLPAVHGLNHVLAEATDAAGRYAEADAAAYHSLAFHPYGVEDAELSRVPGAMHIYLAQEMLDDGDQDLSKIDDFATLLSVALQDLDLAEIGDGAVFWSETLPEVVDEEIVISGVPIELAGDAIFTARVSDVIVPEAPSVGIDARDGGMLMTGDFAQSADAEAPAGVEILLTMRAELPINVYAEVMTNIGIGDLELVYDEMITPHAEWIVSLSLDNFAFSADTDISKLSGEPLEVTIIDLQLDTDGFEISPFDTVYIDLGEISLPIIGSVSLPTMSLDDLVAPLNDLFGESFLSPIGNSLLEVSTAYLAPLLKDEVAPLMGALMQAFETDTVLDAPRLKALGPEEEAVVLSLNTELDTVTFTEDGGEISLAGLTQGPGALEIDPMGSILRDSCSGFDTVGFTFAKQHPMEVGFHVDLLNQVLHAAWWAGTLNTVLEDAEIAGAKIASYGLTDGQIETNFLLPPILDDCNTKEILRAQVGDLNVKGSFTYQGKEVSVEAYLTIDAEVLPVSNGSDVDLKAGMVQTAKVTIVEVNGPANFDSTVFVDIVQDFVVPTVLETVTAKVLKDLPLPAINASSLHPVLPDDVVFELGDLEAVHDKGVIGLGGGLK
ncbi:MAG: hypothetical protein CL940_04295 [Deltaproteobacteria bacterium]|nr:hypothetical protein [Deltaproteobacteria bacterium]